VPYSWLPMTSSIRRVESSEEVWENRHRSARGMLHAGYSGLSFRPFERAALWKAAIPRCQSGFITSSNSPFNEEAAWWWPM